MPADTSFYNTIAPQSATSSDPTTEAMNLIKLRNAMGNVNKVQSPPAPVAGTVQPDGSTMGANQ